MRLAIEPAGMKKEERAGRVSTCMISDDLALGWKTGIGYYVVD